MDLTTSGWLTWYTKNDRYSRAKLNADLDNAARVLPQPRLPRVQRRDRPRSRSRPTSRTSRSPSPSAKASPTPSPAVRLDGDYLGKDDEFKQLIGIRAGEPYRAAAVTDTTKAFTDLFGTFGYAFARVDARTEIDRANGQVAVVLAADPQRRVYVRRIDVAGNTRTRDEVVRREFRQLESRWYDGERIKLSRDRVDRLGYFKEVDVDENEVAGTADQVDLTVNVTEKPTGNLLLGVSFSSADRLALSASVKQDNVFGSGNYLGIEVNTSKTGRSLVFSTVDPYFTVDGISRAIDLYYRTSRPFNSLGDQYQIANPGGAIRFGVPFSEYDTVFFGIGIEQTNIGANTGIPEQYFDYRQPLRRQLHLAAADAGLGA